MEGRMDGIKAPMSIAMIVLSSLMLITTLCPWGTITIPFAGTTSFLGVEVWHGILCLILSAGAIALACIDVVRKFSVIPNALAMIFMIVFYVQYGKAVSLGVSDFGFGIIMFTLFAIAHLVISIIVLVKK